VEGANLGSSGVYVLVVEVSFFDIRKEEGISLFLTVHAVPRVHAVSYLTVPRIQRPQKVALWSHCIAGVKTD
jgi:hypothetical protein